MFLIEVTINTVLNRLSMEGIALTHWWDNQVISFDPPVYRTSEKRGGFCSLSFGSVSFSPDLFGSDWPPPINCVTTIYYTETTEEAKQKMFEGTLHLNDIKPDEIIYAFYPETVAFDLLDEGYDYDADEEVPYPRAFGEVTHVTPLRLADAGGGNYRYDMGHITGTALNCGEAGGDIWCVYDDGVDISGNVANVAANVFELTSAPVGIVTMTGTGEDTTITEIFNWAATRISYTLDSTYVATPAPSISYWADRQRPITDFLDKLAQFYVHLFYLRDDFIYLVAMSADNESTTLDGYDYISTSLEYMTPISQITTKWETRAPGEWSEEGNPGTAAGVYVKKTLETVAIDGGYSYGNELSIHDVFAYTRVGVTDALTDILVLEKEPDVLVVMPFKGTLPLPGKRITLTDETMKVDSTIIMHVRDIYYDIDNDEIRLVGNGSSIAEKTTYYLMFDTEIYLTTEAGDHLIVIET